MRPRIHSVYVECAGMAVAFLRISKYFAWHATVNGQNYGDWVTVPDDPITDEIQKETMLILADQVALMFKYTQSEYEDLKIGIKSFYDRPRNT